MVSKDELQTRSDFSERYRVRAAVGILDDVERRITGAVWGSNGFTTQPEADTISRLLRVGPGKLLVDLGAGFGWPGLYLARESGCDVVVSDMTTEGLEVAVRRAAAEKIRLIGAVACSARYPPFAAASFDAIVHTDVFC